MEELSCLHLMEQFGSLFQVPLLQPNPHRQEGLARHLRSPLPLVRPLRQLSLMHNMGRWDLPLAHGLVAPGGIAVGVREGTAGHKGNTAGQYGRNLSEQHLSKETRQALAATTSSVAKS